MSDRFKSIFEWLGRAGKTFLAFAALYLVLGMVAPNGAVRVAALTGMLVAGIWLTVRLLRRATGPVLWRLRNRLLVTYLFIAALPILLVAALAGLSIDLLVRQLAVYMVTSQLDRRIETLASFTDSVVRTDPTNRPSVMARSLDLFYRDRFPGIEILLREGGQPIRYPEEATEASIPPPVEGWKPTSGVLVRDGKNYLWSYAKTAAGDVTVMAPLTREFLSQLVPNLGQVDIGEEKASDQKNVRDEAGDLMFPVAALPPAKSRFDLDVLWFATLPVDDWRHPGEKDEELLVEVRSRFSAVLLQVFKHKDKAQSVLIAILIIVSSIFIVVEIVSLIIGIGIARTITRAVHRLYEGTQRVIAGDFSHRIEVSGKDQLAELGLSFNRMTEHLQRLLVVAKEKERLESEIEIAREVQGQLFPHEIPELRTLRIKAVCQPARLVSGDYYDFQMVGDSEVALAIADVAGKGISAALLMAALQSSLRIQLQMPVEVLAGGGNGHQGDGVSTSRLVSSLNRQLHSTTSAEKYATFFLGVYDEPSSTLTYTNAGHLAPMLVRDGAVELLDVNGTVVGAFPFSEYDESRVQLRSGDLLVCYTDGVTEPENEYGEMFGEERLMELLLRNSNRPEEEIIQMVLDSVRQWTGSEELQDDMTLLLARRV
ncbi:MAG TPA: SpoIIE family protein phosphatase [Bryobacteraceae bacterium]